MKDWSNYAVTVLERAEMQFPLWEDFWAMIISIVHFEMAPAGEFEIRDCRCNPYGHGQIALRVFFQHKKQEAA